MVKLRKFTYEDIDFILSNWVESDQLSGYFKNCAREVLVQKITKYNEEKSGDRFLFTYCIEFENKPVGLLQFTEKHAGIPNLNIYIEDDFQKRGIGSEAFELGKKIIKEKGFNLITSSCAKANFKSMHFHKKVGFELIKEELSPNGTPMCRWKYELK